MPKERKAVPAEAVAFTAIFTSILAVYIPPTFAGVPGYARISLLVIAVNNMFKAVQHWLAIPDAGLGEFELGPQSVSRTLAIAFRRKHGQELFWFSLVLVYISYYAPQLTFLMLKIQLLRAIFYELTNLVYSPFSLKDKFIAANTSESYSSVDLVLVVTPLLYAYLVSDV
jgi:hypothetical protein